MTTQKRRALTAKERRFIEEYVTDWNAAAAARRAGYSERTARQIGYENLTKPHIADAIDERARELNREIDLRPGDMIRVVKRQVNRDIRRLFHPDGRHKGIEELSAEEASWISGYEVVIKNAAAGDRVTDTVLKVRLNPLDRFVELGGKLGQFGLFEERVSVSASSSVLEALAEGRKRVAEAKKAREARTAKKADE